MTLLEQLRHQAGPAGLVAGADASPVVAVKVLVKQDVLAPVRVVLKLALPTVDRSATVGAAEEEQGSSVFLEQLRALLEWGRVRIEAPGGAAGEKGRGGVVGRIRRQQQVMSAVP